jgi:hypothetical protein
MVAGPQSTPKRSVTLALVSLGCNPRSLTGVDHICSKVITQIRGRHFFDEHQKGSFDQDLGPGNGSEERSLVTGINFSEPQRGSFPNRKLRQGIHGVLIFHHRIQHFCLPSGSRPIQRKANTWQVGVSPFSAWIAAPSSIELLGSRGGGEDRGCFKAVLSPVKRHGTCSNPRHDKSGVVARFDESSALYSPHTRPIRRHRSRAPGKLPLQRPNRSS